MPLPPDGNPPRAAARERRSGIDRRGARRLIFRSLLFGGRREFIRRRADRQRIACVDRYQSSLFGVIVLILLLSVTDAILTILLISHGAVEINPIMAFYLELGPYPFLFVKYALTSVGLLILLVFRSRFLESMRMHTGTFLYVVLAAFLGVVSWEIFLINKVII